MTRLDIRLPIESKAKLVAISRYDNRSITKEIIQLIEDRYRAQEDFKVTCCYCGHEVDLNYTKKDSKENDDRICMDCVKTLQGINATIHQDFINKHEKFKHTKIDREVTIQGDSNEI